LMFLFFKSREKGKPPHETGLIFFTMAVDKYVRTPPGALLKIN